MAETTTIRVDGEGITVSLLVWRFLKRKPAGYVEQVMELNSSIAGQSIFLPVGSVITMPLLIEEADQAVPVISLWD